MAMPPIEMPAATVITIIITNNHQNNNSLKTTTPPPQQSNTASTSIETDHESGPKHEAKQMQRRKPLSNYHSETMSMESLRESPALLLATLDLKAYSSMMSMWCKGLDSSSAPERWTILEQSKSKPIGSTYHDINICLNSSVRRHLYEQLQAIIHTKTTGATRNLEGLWQCQWAGQ